MGPNGAGKTTILKTIVACCDGVRLGHPVRTTPRDPASRRQVGFLPEKSYFYDYLTAKEFLDSTRACSQSLGRRGPAIDELLVRVGMAWAATARCEAVQGMVQRGHGAGAPRRIRSLILDERCRAWIHRARELRDIILSLRAADAPCVLVHILQDAEMICDRVGILKRGRLGRKGAGRASRTGDAAYE